MKQLLREIDAKELIEWQLYDQMDPIGMGDRADVNAATIAATIANANRDPKRRSRPYSPDDFIPRYAPREDPKVLEVREKQDRAMQMLAYVEQLNVRLGGTDLRNTVEGVGYRETYDPNPPGTDTNDTDTAPDTDRD